MQKNLSPAPVMTSTRVRVSRRMASMQSRISWHMVTLNMLPSCGRLSVSHPIGPSSSYSMVSKVKSRSPSDDASRAQAVDPLAVVAEQLREHRLVVFAEQRRRDANAGAGAVDLDAEADLRYGPAVMLEPI